MKCISMLLTFLKSYKFIENFEEHYKMTTLKCIMCKTYSSLTGTFKVIPLYYGFWSRNVYFNDVTLLQTY